MGINAANTASFVLGAHAASHLGDILCMSALPRLLTLHRDMKVYLTRQPNMKAVFKNNPYIAGFADGPVIKPGYGASRCGHIMQRLAQGMELPLEPPKPEIYLDDNERVWATNERQKWPADRPICLISSGALSDRHNLAKVDWPAVADVLSRRYTIVQPTLRENPLPRTIHYPDLSIRQYMALVSVADAFCGGTSGGSHVAAAFDIPALVIGWRSLLHSLKFPISNGSFAAWFLYPQHSFIASEDISLSHFDEASINHVIDIMAINCNQDRRKDLGCDPNISCGFAPRAFTRLTQTSRGRFIRVPGAYGESTFTKENTFNRKW